MDIFSRADVCIEGTGHTSTTKIGVVFASVFPLQPTVPLVVEKMADELQPIFIVRQLEKGGGTASHEDPSTNG